LVSRPCKKCLCSDQIVETILYIFFSFFAIGDISYPKCLPLSHLIYRAAAILYIALLMHLKRYNHVLELLSVPFLNSFIL
jgi:hypothetical protein